jgi:predicted transcriptional regulator
MTPLPDRRPKQLSLGPLESEILDILHTLGSATVKDIHARIVCDPTRELAIASVTTILNRLAKKGWVAFSKAGRAFLWQPLISREEAQMLKAHDRLQQFLEVGNADLIAAFADSLDTTSWEKLEAIAQRIQAIRQQREET